MNVLSSKPISIVCLLAYALCAPALAGPDSFTPPWEIGLGREPAIAVDYQRSVVHLAYVTAQQVYYRTGKLDGTFGPPEVIFTEPDWRVDFRYTGIAVDSKGNAHIIFVWMKIRAEGEFYFSKGMYTNNIGGTWKEFLPVYDQFSNPDAGGCGTPFITIDNKDRVLISSWQGHRGGSIVRLVDLATTPRIEKNVKNPNFHGYNLMFIRKDTLWVAYGRPPKHQAHGFTPYHAETLAKLGKGYHPFGPQTNEIIGAGMDHTGEIHIASAPYMGSSAARKGWYSRLSWARQGKKTLSYFTTNGHHVSGTTPVGDRGAKDRTYVFYFSGHHTKEHFYQWCSPGSQLKFMRVENGANAADNKPVAPKESRYGYPYRALPCAAALPGGGALVIYEECQGNAKAGNIWMGDIKIYSTLVGETGGLDLGGRDTPAPVDSSTPGTPSTPGAPDPSGELDFTAPHIRLNFGRPPVEGWHGGDQFADGGEPFSFFSPLTPTGIPGEAPADVYQGVIHCKLEEIGPGIGLNFPDLPAGSYLLRLHVTDSYGERAIDISAEGQPVVTDLDPITAAGGAMKPVAKEVSVVVDGDGLQLRLSDDRPEPHDAFLSGLEIIRDGKIGVFSPRSHMPSSDLRSPGTAFVNIRGQKLPESGFNRANVILRVSPGGAACIRALTR